MSINPAVMYITITEYRGDGMFHVPMKEAIKIILVHTTKRHKNYNS